MVLTVVCVCVLGWEGAEECVGGCVILKLMPGNFAHMCANKILYCWDCIVPAEHHVPMNHDKMEAPLALSVWLVGCPVLSSTSTVNISTRALIDIREREGMIQPCYEGQVEVDLPKRAALAIHDKLETVCAVRVIIST